MAFAYAIVTWNKLRQVTVWKDIVFLCVVLQFGTICHPISAPLIRATHLHNHSSDIYFAKF